MRMGRPVPLPAEVAACLEQALGESVNQVRIIEHSLFARLHVRAVATTRRRRIYLRGSAADFFSNPCLQLDSRQLINFPLVLLQFHLSPFKFARRLCRFQYSFS